MSTIINRQTRIEQSLTQDLSPQFLQVLNESHMHSVPANSETHFKCIVVSEQFESLNKVKRHQRVYACVNKEMVNGLHAIAIHAYTPQEWAERQETAPASPDCKGGSKHESLS